MRILIIHRVPYSKVPYELWIDHNEHQVFYWKPSVKANEIPASIRAVVLDQLKTADELVRWSVGKIDRVVALSEYDLLLAARIREACGIFGINIHRARLVRDKVAMKEAVVRSGLRAPRYFRLSEYPFFKHEKWLSGRIILKPVDGASSDRVLVLNGLALDQYWTSRVWPLNELNDCHDEILERFEVEEFVEGRILHIDGWVDRGRLKQIVMSRYVGNCLSYTRGEPLGSYQFSVGDDQSRAWVSKILKSLSIDSGAFHLEAIESATGLVFLELGHRVGGAGVAKTFEAKTGINLYGIHIFSQLGWPLREFLPKVHEPFYSWFVFPGHHLEAGKYQICGIEDLDIDAQWEDLYMNQGVAQDGTVSLSYQESEVPLAGRLKSSSTVVLENSLEKLFEQVKISTVIPQPEAAGY